MNRVKVSISVDPQLLSSVDAFVSEHQGLDRSKVMDQALALWSAAQQEAAMEAQFSDAIDDPVERYAWRSVRRQAAERRLRRS